MGRKFLAIKSCCTFACLVAASLAAAHALADPGASDPRLRTDSAWGQSGVTPEGEPVLDEPLDLLGEAYPISDESGSPRAPGVTGCGEIVFNNLAGATASTGISGGCAGTTGTNGIATGNGNLITLGGPGGNRDICAVTVRLQNTTDTTGDCALLQPTPFDVTCEIWNSCPATANVAGVCGNSGATLLGTATTTGIVIAPATAQDISIVFSPAIANVPNSIAVIFRASRAGISVQIGGTPTIGSNSNGLFTRCGSIATNNGCTRNFGTGINTTLFQVEASVSAGLGSCCDLITGNCVDGVAVANCLGSTNQFTLGGTCATANCHIAVGGCCLPDTCLDNQTITQCNSVNGTFKGDNISCASAPFCATVCSFGSEGQALDRVGHGAGGIVATVSDTNPLVPQAVADNFTPVSNGSITHVRWWGYYRMTPAAPCGVQAGSSPDAFTITLYNSALDLPFQVVAGPFAVSPTKVDTGFQFNGRNYWRFDATGLNIPVIGNQCYFMEILNHTTGDCSFFWATGPAGDLKSAGGAVNSMYSVGDEQDYDMSWCMDIDIEPDGCIGTPELAGACCLGGGTSCDDSMGPSACLTAGGTFVGFLQTCTPGLCDGACCNPNDFTCSIQVELNCLNLGRVFQGVGTVCTPTPCQGACCLGDGTCTQVSKIECESALPGGFGGSFTGGASCGSVVCSQNDICLATVMNCNSSRTFNNAGQANLETFDPNTDTAPAMSCFGGGPSNGIGSFWVTFTGTGSDVELSTCNSAVDDTVIAVYDDNGGGCTAITAADEVACSEDDASCPGLQSKVCVPTTNGTQYWVQVTSFDDLSVGSITIDVTCPCPVAGCATCPGDVSGDSTIDGEDIAGFVSCLLGGGSNCVCGDMNADTLTNLNDISGFVTALLNSTGPCP